MKPSRRKTCIVVNFVYFQYVQAVCVSAIHSFYVSGVQGQLKSNSMDAYL